MKLLERFKYTRIFDYELANCENCENLENSAIYIWRIRRIFIPFAKCKLKISFLNYFNIYFERVKIRIGENISSE